MGTQTIDKCCTFVPYFKVHEGKMEKVKELCDRFVEKTRSETDCLYYGFTFNGDKFHCREGYKNAAGILKHLENIDLLFKELITIADLTSLEIHGPEEELNTLREPLAGLKPDYWTLEYGFRI